MEQTVIAIVLYAIAGFLLAFLLTPAYIAGLKRLKLAKVIRTEATIGKAVLFNQLHAHKAGTPTMGGGVILLSVFAMVGFSAVIYALRGWLKERYGFELNNSLFSRKETYLSLFTLASVGALGFVDDLMNILGLGKRKGLSARVKLLGLVSFGLAGGYWFFYKIGFDSVTVPLLGSVALGWVYVPVAAFILAALANAVNITDGLDGLAGGLLIQNYALYALITYLDGKFLLSTLCLVIVGALGAFLWYNVKPAKFFMGDVGSLALGANLAVMALMTNTLAVLVIVSLIYVWEILSVVIQLLSKKLRGGKKVFLIAPFHHHLQAQGLAEETIVMKAWLIQALLTGAGVIAFFLIR